MDYILQIQFADQLRKVTGIGVHVVVISGLTRSPMTSPVMRDASVSLTAQKQHLVIASVCAQGPAMAKDYGLALTPVLVMDLRPIFGCEVRHDVFSATRKL